MYSFSTKGICSKRIKIEANGRRIPLLVLKPKSESVNAPGVMWIHGGGYMTGMKEISKIERGVANPSVNTLNRIAVALGAQLVVTIA